MACRYSVACTGAIYPGVLFCIPQRRGRLPPAILCHGTKERRRPGGVKSPPKQRRPHGSHDPRRTYPRMSRRWVSRCSLSG